MGRRDKRTRGPKQKPPSPHTSTSSSIKTVLLSILVVAAAISTGLYFLSKQQRYFEADTNILFHADLLRDIMLLNQSIHGLEHHDLMSAVDRRLRSAQNQLQSLSKQTEVYEDLQSKNPVQGGPKNFVATTLKHLAELDAEVNNKIRLEIIAATEDYEHKWDQTSKLNAQALFLEGKVKDFDESAHMVEWYAKRYIRFKPFNEETFRMIEEHSGHITIEEVEYCVRRLGEIYKEHEQVNLKLIELRAKPEFANFRVNRSVSEAEPEKYPVHIEIGKVGDKLEHLQGWINEEIRENANYYMFTHSLVEGKVSLLKERLYNAFPKYFLKKASFLDLHRLLVSDIKKLKKRLENLAAV